MTPKKDGIPSLKKDLQNAKLFLQQSGANGDSLFDHLSNVIAKVIDERERPKNVVDHFELFSERVRLETFAMNENSPEDAYNEPTRLAIAQKLLPLFIEKSKQAIKVADDDETPEQSTREDAEEEDDDVIYYESPPRDLCELQFYWNLLGIGFQREEVDLIACSMAKLQANPDVLSCRLWGKMFALKSDYYVVECALSESAFENRIVSSCNVHGMQPTAELRFIEI